MEVNEPVCYILIYTFHNKEKKTIENLSQFLFFIYLISQIFFSISCSILTVMVFIVYKKL